MGLKLNSRSLGAGSIVTGDLVRSVTSHSSGSWYFELTINAATDVTKVGVGLDNNKETLTGGAGRAGSVVWYGDGSVTYNGLVWAYTAPKFNVGDVLGIDVDLTGDTIRFRVNGGSFTSTFSIASVSNGQALLALAQLSALSDQVTANFLGTSPAFAHTAPSTAWG